MSDEFGDRKIKNRTEDTHATKKIPTLKGLEN